MSNNAFYDMILISAQAAGAWAGSARTGLIALGAACLALACREVARQWVLVLNASGGAAPSNTAQTARLLGAGGLACALRRGVRPRRWRLDPPASLAALGMGGAAVLLVHAGDVSISDLATLAALGILLMLAIVDARTGFLPDVLTLPLLWGGLLAAWLGGPLEAHRALAGAMAAYASLWLGFHAYQRVRGREGMGRGDFKLFAALGAWLGPGLLPHVLLLACAAGVVHAVLRPGKTDLSASYPFGPFLAGAGAIVLLIQ